MKAIKLIICVISLISLVYCSFETIDTKFNGQVRSTHAPFVPLSNYSTQQVLQLDGYYQLNVYAGADFKVYAQITQNNANVVTLFEVFDDSGTSGITDYFITACTTSKAGTFAVVRQYLDGTNYNIKAIAYEFDTTAKTVTDFGAQNVMNGLIAETGKYMQCVPQGVTTDPSIMVVWQGHSASGNMDVNYMPINLVSGVGNIGTINATTANPQIKPSITQLRGSNSSKYIATWAGYSSCSGNPNTLWLAQFDGSAWSTEVENTKANVACADSSNTQVTATDDGGFVVTYTQGSNIILHYYASSNLANLAVETWTNVDGTKPTGNDPQILSFDDELILISQSGSSGSSNSQQIVYKVSSFAVHQDYTTIYSSVTDQKTLVSGVYSRVSLSLLQGSEGPFIVGVQFLVSASTEVQYYEYFFKNKVLCTGDYDPKFGDCILGFFNKCAGSTVVQRNIRYNDIDCGCDDGYFHQEGVMDCIKCDFPCLTCSTLGKCNDCKTNTLKLPFCIENTCPDGFYVNGSSCEDCNSSCATCEDNSSCTSCANPTYLMPSCQQNECVYGEYKDGIQCLACDNECGSCSAGPNGGNKNCDTCADTDKKAPDCVDSCPTGTYEESLKCHQCMTVCSACEDGTSCTACSTPGNIVPLCTSANCEDGYYKDGSECKECDYACKTCTQAGSCTECSESGYYLPDCIYSQVGFFSVTVGGQQVISECDTKCFNCENSSDHCIGGKCGGNNRDFSNKCACLIGYHDNDGSLTTCEPCPDTCKTCVTYYQCDSCVASQNRQINNFTGECVCKKGFTEQQDSKVCVKCYQIMDGCTDECPPNTVQNEINMVCEPLNYELKSNNTLIFIFGGVVVIVQLLICIGIKKQLQFKYAQFTGEYQSKVNEIKEKRKIIYKDMEGQLGSGIGTTKLTSGFNQKIRRQKISGSILDSTSHNNLLDNTKQDSMHMG